MTVETFFANFGHLADAPNGVQKLRELILQLAVQGKLVPQDDNDEPASVLLEKIFGRKEQLIKEGKLRMTKVPFAFDDNEQTELPPTWVYSTLYDIGEIAPRNDSEDGAEASFVPMAQISEFYGIPAQSETRAWGEIKSGFTHFAEGDVCLAKITPCYQNGKSAVMRELRNGIGAGTTELHVFRAIDELVSPDYVLIFLKSPLFINEGIPRMTGSAGQKRITRDYFAGKPFPLPPLKEQKRIVAKVDQLMALCNELETRQQKQQQGRVRLNSSALDALLTAREPDEFAGHWQRISTNFDLLYDHPETIAKLRAAILQLAVQGKLVSQNLQDKPDEVLNGNKLLANENDVPFIVPSNWTWKPLGKLTSLITSGSRGWKEFYAKSGATFIRSQDIKYDRLEYDQRAFVKLPGKTEGLRTKVSSGDLLVTITGANVAKAALIGEDPGEAYVSQHVALIRLKDCEHGPYIHKWLVGECGGRKLLLESSYGAKPGLNLQNLRDLLVPIPPLEEQKRIVAKVDQIMDLCDELETKLKQAQQHSGKLMETTVRQVLGIASPKQPHTARCHPATPRLKAIKPRPAYNTAPTAAMTVVAEAPASYAGSIPEAILRVMQPGKVYCRAEILAATGIAESDWTWAIRQLKEQGRVLQNGEKRGVQYRLVK
jgi:type I restriction enzyme S subunit